MKKGRAATRPNFVISWEIHSLLCIYNKSNTFFVKLQAYLIIAALTAWRILSMPFLVDARLSMYIMEY